MIFDAYGTLLRNEHDRLIPQRIVGDHRLATPVDEVLRAWFDLYCEATQQSPFRSLRQIHTDILQRLLQRLRVDADAAPYVDLFFEVTTRVELYPEVREVLSALAPRRSAILSNADHEHVAAWTFTLPVELILISEAIGAYKPHPLVFRTALERLGLQPDEVLHVGDSEIDDVAGAKAAGLRVAWVNRDGRARRGGAPAPDFEIRDLKGLLSVLD